MPPNTRSVSKTNKEEGKRIKIDTEGKNKMLSETVSDYDSDSSDDAQGESCLLAHSKQDPSKTQWIESKSMSQYFRGFDDLETSLAMTIRHQDWMKKKYESTKGLIDELNALIEDLEKQEVVADKSLETCFKGLCTEETSVNNKSTT